MAEIRNDPEENRYELSIDGHVVGSAFYTLTGESIIFTHTEVEPNREERGLGSQLVKFALDDVRDHSQLRVIPQCPFVASFIRKHPEYEDLLRR